MWKRIVNKGLFTTVVIVGLFVLPGTLSAQGNRKWVFERIKKVQKRHTERLMAMDGVEGTGIGLDQGGQLVVKVFTARHGVAGIGKKLDDVPVHVVVTGKILALSTTDRLDRPVPIGVSTGNEGQRSSGTIACRVKKGNNVYALSNNHVYALENDAPLGSEVLQPGLYDTAGVYNKDNVIGVLADFEPIKFRRWARNEIDAAIALSSTVNLGTATPPGAYGIPSSETATASVGLAVQKYGRTTGLTSGEITSINATVRVGYDSGVARFVGQIIIQPTGSDPFSDGGDSGSLIVTDDDKLNPVGLLFAGSSTVTIANPIDLVLARFGVTVDDSEGPVDNPPVADFMGSPTSGDAPLIVNFTDLSTGEPTSWLWNFGDGGTSTAQNLSYTYGTPGTYTVTLTATNAYGSDLETKVDYIVVTEQTGNPPTADFSASSTSGDAPLIVNFTDLSTGEPTSWSWNFGDGGTSTAQSLSYTYGTPGTYTVTLTATNAYGFDLETKVDHIVVTEQTGNPPTADFSASSTSGDAPLIVNFTDLSTGEPTSWSWNFGDGGTSTAQNLSYTYVTPGTYTVTLTATNAYGSDLETKVDYIVVTEQTGNPPTADFLASSTSGDAPLIVNFTDLSTGEPTSWSWNFGDGGTSTAQNPSYTYNTPGTHTVTLTATNAYGSDSETKVEYITVSEAQAGDGVTITKADYRRRNSQLSVEATSTGSPDAVLTVYGSDGQLYGQMTYNRRKDKYRLRIKSADDPQGWVKVVSSLGASATKTVRYK
jgi:PKD repeat protein